MIYTLTYISRPGQGRCIPSSPPLHWEQPGFDDSKWLPPAQASNLTGTVPVFVLGFASSSLITAVAARMSGPVYSSAESFRFYVTMPNVPVAQLHVSSVSLLGSSSEPNVVNATNFFMNGVQATGITYNTPVHQFTVTFDASTILPGKNVMAITNSKPDVPFYWSCLSFILSITYQYPVSLPDDLAAWLVVNEPTIGLTDQSHYLSTGQDGQHTFNLQTKQRGTANYTMVVASTDPAADPTYEPTIGSPMFLYDQTKAGYTLVFSGIIQSFKNRQIGLKGDRYIDVVATSLEVVLDEIYAEPQQFINQTCGAMVSQLFGTYALGSQVSIGVVLDGPVIPILNTNYEKLSDLFSQLATTAGFVWGVNPQNQQLYFCPPDNTASPFSLSSALALWDSINWEDDASDYRNRQAIRLSYDAFTHSAETFLNDGSGTQKQFTLMRPVEQVTNCWVTLSTPNKAVGIFSGQPAVGDTVTIGPANGAWQGTHIYGLNGVIVVNGFVQKVTTAGTSGGSTPAFSSVTGATTTDGSVIWTNQGPLGLGTGQQTYTFCGPDQSSISPHDGQWFPATTYGASAELFIIGQLVQQSGGGTSGATAPVWPTTIGGTVSDGTITWTCLGPWLDNTQFGLVLIGSNSVNTCQNLADAINANAAVRGITFSLPTWENSQGNAINVASVSFTIQQKGPGTGYISSLSFTGSHFSWVTGGSPSTAVTATFGGTSPQGSLGPNQGATISLQVYAVGTNTAAPSLSFTPGSNIVNLATPLSKGNLVVEYTRPDGNVIEVENTALVTALGAQTYGTGKVQQFSDQSSQGLIALSSAAGLQLAQQALAAYDVVPEKITVEILQPGIITGQQVTLNFTGALSILNGTYFVEEVMGELVKCFPWLDSPQAPGAGHYHYTFTLINIAQIGSYMDFWQGLGGGSSSGSGGGGGGTGSSLAATSGGGFTSQGSSLTQGGVNNRFGGDYTPTADDNGHVVTFSDNVTPRTLHLPNPPPFAQWNIFIENIGFQNLAVDPNGQQIDFSAGGLVIPQNQGVYIATDGVNYFTSRGLLPVSNVGAMFQIATVTVGVLTTKISFPAIPNAYNHLQIKIIAAQSDGIWQAGHVYTVGTIVVFFFTATSTYYYWKVTTGGTSGGSIPAFSTTSSGTLADGSVVWTNQGVDAATEVSVSMVFNNDLSVTNYFVGFVYPAASGSVNPVGAIPSAGPFIGFAPTPRNARPAIPVSGVIDIPFYRNTTFGKSAVAMTGWQRNGPGSGNQEIFSASVGYLPLSAITQIDFYIGDGTYFAAGSQAILYGIS